MSDIKTKEVKKGTIKTFDKSLLLLDKIKNTTVKYKDNYLNYEEENTEYATNKIIDNLNNITNNGIYYLKHNGRKSVNKTKNNYYKIKTKINKYKNHLINKKQAKKNIKTIKNTGKVTIKTTKTTIKTTKKTIQTSIKAAKKAYQISKVIAKLTVKAIKITIKAIIATIKGIIAAINGLISLITAGGWIVLVIILVICMIALLVSSVYGIFFSSEDTGSEISSGDTIKIVTMDEIVNDINTEFMKRINNIINENIFDNYEIEQNRAKWKDVLAVYSVKMSNGNQQVDVVTLNNEKVTSIKNIFWDMNSIKDFIIEQEDGTKLLKINITSKTATQMAEEYKFSNKQLEQLNELLSYKYSNMWNSVIYGKTNANNDIVKVAVEQIGNAGGEKFWSWYGFNSRVEWCAIFVSWCAEQCGYIDSGIVPKFASCDSQGIPYFKSCGLWKDGGSIPKSGDIIFYDWQSDGISDHVGIVEKVEDGVVYAIEGNSDDMCKRLQYDINSNFIMGYGTPMY